MILVKDDGLIGLDLCLFDHTLSDKACYYAAANTKYARLNVWCLPISPNPISPNPRVRAVGVRVRLGLVLGLGLGSGLGSGLGLWLGSGLGLWLGSELGLGLGLGWGLGLGLGSGLHHALRHDALSMSVSNNFVHIRRIEIRRNGAEPNV